MGVSESVKKTLLGVKKVSINKQLKIRKRWGEQEARGCLVKRLLWTLDVVGGGDTSGRGGENERWGLNEIGEAVTNREMGEGREPGKESTAST